MPGECGHQTAKERFRSWLHALRRSSRRRDRFDGTANQPLLGEEGDV